MRKEHRNIRFAVHRLDDKRWEWVVYSKIGEGIGFGGTESDEERATATARAEIDAWLNKLENRAGEPSGVDRMAEENEHTRKLVEARNRQVEQRRSIAGALAQPYERGETEGMREAFIAVQKTIEAIERAIAHEEYIASKDPKSSWPQAIGFRSTPR